jgi:hypothetical protein
MQLSICRHSCEARSNEERCQSCTTKRQVFRSEPGNSEGRRERQADVLKARRISNNPGNCKDWKRQRRVTGTPSNVCGIATVESTNN